MGWKVKHSTTAVWHLEEHQDDGMEREDARRQPGLFSERTYWSTMSLDVTVQTSPEICHYMNNSRTVVNRAVVLHKDFLLSSSQVQTSLSFRYFKVFSLSNSVAYLCSCCIHRPILVFLRNHLPGTAGIGCMELCLTLLLKSHWKVTLSHITWDHQLLGILLAQNDDNHNEWQRTRSWGENERE